MTTLDTTATLADGILVRLACLAGRILAAIGREIACTVTEDLAHGRIDSHRDEY